MISDAVDRHSVSPNHSLTTSEESSSSGSGHVSSLSQTLISQFQLSKREERRYKPPPQDQSQDTGLGYNTRATILIIVFIVVL